jgi:hypothetical protein
MFCRDPNKCLGQRRLTSASPFLVSSGLGDREFRCFRLDEIHIGEKGKEFLPDAMLMALSTLCQLLNTRAMAEKSQSASDTHMTHCS